MHSDWNSVFWLKLSNVIETKQKQLFVLILVAPEW